MITVRQMLLDLIHDKNCPELEGTEEREEALDLVMKQLETEDPDAVITYWGWDYENQVYEYWVEK